MCGKQKKTRSTHRKSFNMQFIKRTYTFAKKIETHPLKLKKSPCERLLFEMNFVFFMTKIYTSFIKKRSISNGIIFTTK